MRRVGGIIALQPSTESYAAETAAGVILVVPADIGGTLGTGTHCGTLPCNWKAYKPGAAYDHTVSKRQSGEVVRLSGSQGTIAEGIRYLVLTG
jgi:hypothetical protein